MIAGPAAIFSRLRLTVFRLLFLPGYHTLARLPWRAELLKTLAPRTGDRILEISPGWCSSCGELAGAYPKVHSAAIQRDDGPEIMAATNVEHVSCSRGCIACDGASFDKVICALALHPLMPEEKLTLLKEMRRVLRHGGTLHLAELDKPLTTRKDGALRGTSYIFGPEAARPHLDGTWLSLVEQAGFAGVRRIKNCSEDFAQVAIIKARRA
ncbi:MAG: methyltransferase domain-containing protein [Xanthobacteraceae bacterium]|nr:methyltransferase domain-containing protein [Xanthobacteraceae bacterium]